MSTARKLLSGSVLNLINLVVQAAVVCVITPVIVAALGHRMYGIWILVMSFIGYYALLDLGISSAIARHISKALGQHDKQTINEVINTGLRLFLIVGAVALFSACVLFALCGFLVADADELRLFRKLIAIFSLLVAVSFPTKVFQGVLKAHLRYDFANYASLARVVLANTAIYHFLRSGYGVIALAYITFASALLEYALTIWFAKLAFPELRCCRGLYSRALQKTLFGYSAKSFVITITQQVRFRMDALVIAMFLNVKFIAYYSIGTRFMEYFVDLVGSFMGGLLMPVFSKYEGSGKPDVLKARFLNACRFSTMMSVFLGGSILFYGKPFILRWMGEGFLSSYTIIQILTVPYALNLMQTPGAHLLYGISKHHYFAYINSVAAVLNLVCSVILLKHFSFQGVAMGTAIELSVSAFVLYPWAVCKALDLSLHKYFHALFWSSFKTAVPLVVYFWFVHEYVEPSYPKLLVFAVLQTLLFIPIGFFLVLGKTERMLLIQVFKSAERRPESEKLTQAPIKG